MTSHNDFYTNLLYGPGRTDIKSEPSSSSISSSSSESVKFEDSSATTSDSSSSKSSNASSKSYESVRLFRNRPMVLRHKIIPPKLYTDTSMIDQEVLAPRDSWEDSQKNTMSRSRCLYCRIYKVGKKVTVKSAKDPFNGETGTIISTSKKMAQVKLDEGWVISRKKSNLIIQYA